RQYRADAIHGLFDVTGRFEFDQLANSLDDLFLAFLEIAQLVSGFAHVHGLVDGFPSYAFASLRFASEPLETTKDTKVHEGYARKLLFFRESGVQGDEV